MARIQEMPRIRIEMATFVEWGGRDPAGYGGQPAQ